MLNKKIQNKTNLRDEINIILNNHSLKNSLIESQLIISYSAKKLNYLDVKFDEIDIEEIKKIIEERLKGKPLSKIIKQKGFWKDIFYTDENTLDPRSDSEILIENIKNDYNAHSSSNHVYKYVISDKMLRTYFINNSIPTNFPVYNPVLDLISNRQIAIDWSLLNLDFFKPSYRVNVGQYFN